jgi:hypothetical protein
VELLDRHAGECERAQLGVINRGDRFSLSGPALQGPGMQGARFGQDEAAGLREVVAPRPLEGAAGRGARRRFEAVLGEPPVDQRAQGGVEGPLLAKELDAASVHPDAPAGIDRCVVGLEQRAQREPAVCRADAPGTRLAACSGHRSAPTFLQYKTPFVRCNQDIGFPEFPLFAVVARTLFGRARPPEMHLPHAAHLTQPARRPCASRGYGRRSPGAARRPAADQALAPRPFPDRGMAKSSCQPG